MTTPQNVRAAAAAATAAGTALLFALTGCTGGGSDSPGEAASTITECHSPYINDVASIARKLRVDTSVDGEPTPVSAAEYWATSSSAPEGAPSTGWEEGEGNTVVSGSWVVGVTETDSGGWIVSGLGCR